MNGIERLESIINKSRVHLYKPIQIAEILYRYRTRDDFDILDLESYRNSSKRWRDIVTQRLVGGVSTSSQKFQDNLFESNALPPKYIKELAEFNNKSNGLVEAYVYKALENKLGTVYDIFNYIQDAEATTFSLTQLIGLFTTDAGLKRSIDKMYEISVHSLFTTIVRALKVQVSLQVTNKDKTVLADFENFLSLVLGLDSTTTELTVPAALYRAGVANAADRGLDIWANFGPAIQVKHLTLTPALMEDIVGEISADSVVVVCIDAEREGIETLLLQVGWSNKIRGIVTLSDLDKWYDLCLSDKYKDSLGLSLLKDLKREFIDEFPSIAEIKPFMTERGYDKMDIPENFNSN